MRAPNWVSVLSGLALWLAAAAGAAEPATVDVNGASRADLEAVRGVGPALAERILAARQEAPFRDWPDFIHRVRGVGRAGAARLSAAGLNVAGAPYLPAPDSLAAPR